MVKTDLLEQAEMKELVLIALVWSNESPVSIRARRYLIVEID